jgi:hypothetical protein
MPAPSPVAQGTPARRYVPADRSVGPKVFGQPRAFEHLLEWVVRSSNSEDDPFAHKLALERADRFGSGHVDVDNTYRIDRQPLDRGLGCIDQLLHFRQEVIRRHRCA